MLFGRYVWSPKIYVVVWYMFSLVCYVWKKAHGDRRSKDVVNDMKRRGQKEHSKHGDKQNKLIIITKYAMIHLKYYYGSITIREIILSVCVCVVCLCD